MNKTPQQRLDQVKRIMKRLEKEDKNNEFINSEYKNC